MGQNHQGWKILLIWSDLTLFPWPEGDRLSRFHLLTMWRKAGAMKSKTQSTATIRAAVLSRMANACTHNRVAPTENFSHAAKPRCQVAQRESVRPSLHIHIHPPHCVREGPLLFRVGHLIGKSYKNTAQLVVGSRAICCSSW